MTCYGSVDLREEKCMDKTLKTVGYVIGAMVLSFCILFFITPVVISLFGLSGMNILYAIIVFALISIFIGAGIIAYVMKEPQKDNVVDSKKPKKMRLKQPQLDEIKILLQQHKSLREIEAKIQGWRQEGYNVDEIEEMIKEVK